MRENLFNERRGKENTSTAVSHVAPIRHLLEIFGQSANVVWELRVVLGFEGLDQGSKIEEERVVVNEHVPFSFGSAVLVENLYQTEVAVKILVARFDSTQRDGERLGFSENIFREIWV